MCVLKWFRRAKLQQQKAIFEFSVGNVLFVSAEFKPGGNANRSTGSACIGEKKKAPPGLAATDSADDFFGPPQSQSPRRASYRGPFSAVPLLCSRWLMVDIESFVDPGVTLSNRARDLCEWLFMALEACEALALPCCIGYPDGVGGVPCQAA